MLKQLRKNQLWLVPLAILLVGFLGRTLYYYRGVYIPPFVPTDAPEQVVAQLQTPDQGGAETGTLSGIVLVDLAHKNNFRRDEFSILSGRVTAAGGEVNYYNGQTPLQDALRGARAFVVTANAEPYSSDDVRALQSFVADGGRLLLIGDPTRMTDATSINSVAGHFGILYQGDYIYNLVENDDSYLNVYLRDFADDPLAEGVKEIVVRSAGSLRASGTNLLTGDANTFSSLREVPGGVVAMARTTNDNVLALTDLTFMVAPYNGFGDNDRFIDNLAVFLLGGGRQYQLLDFPNLFDGPVDLVYSDSSILEQTFAQYNQLRQMLQQAGAVVSLRDQLVGTDSAVVLGFYGGADARSLAILGGDGISASSGSVNIAGVGQFQTSNSTLFHLYHSPNGVYQIFILADSVKSLQNGLQFLFDGKLDSCLLNEQTALCIGALTATSTSTPTVSETPSGTLTITGTPQESSTPTGTPEGSATPSLTPTVTATP